MSVRVMSAVWDMPMDSSAQKLVLLALADNANDAGECYPSLTTISRKTSLDERTVRRAIRQLQQLGFMSVAERAGRSSLFSISLTTLKNATPINDTPGKNERGQSAPPPLSFLQDTPGKNVPPPLSFLSPTPDIVPPITITEPSSNRSEEPSENQKQQSRVVDFANRPKPGPTPEGTMATKLIEAGMAVTSMHPTLLGWIKSGFTVEQVTEGLKVAKQTLGQDARIRANYVDAILRNQGNANSSGGGRSAPVSLSKTPGARAFPVGGRE